MPKGRPAVARLDRRQRCDALGMEEPLPARRVLQLSA